MAAFGLPNLGQLTDAFKKAQQIQQDAQKLQEELTDMEIEGCDAANRVRVWLSGNQEPIKITINESLLKEGKESAEAAILEALKKAYANSTTTMQSRMEELTGGLNLNLPGIGDEK